MNKVTIIIFIFLCMTFQKLHAQPINIEDAMELAKNFYLSKQISLIKEIQVDDNKVFSKNDTSLFYAFTMKDKKGFVIISANELLDPILAYSFDGYLDFNKSNSLYNFYLENLKSNSINTLRNATLNSSSKKAEWSKLRNHNHSSNKKTRSGVLPLLQTTWNQGCYYNEMCPQDASGPCGKTYAGCVATATGQIMKFWNYPNFGFDSLSYVIQGFNVHADFQNTNYKWDSMPNTLTTYNNSIATLLYHVGVATSLNYGANNTWGGLYPIALTKYFKYSSDIIKMDWWDYQNWNQTLVDSVTKQLDWGRPVYFGIDFPNHAVVCDGYQDTTFFHLNFGWDGSGNGYYKFADVGVRNAIINIYPNTPTSLPQEVSFFSNVLIYPNPTEGIINIKLPTINNELINLELFNSIGQRILSEKINNPKSTLQINIEKYSKGIYYLKIQTSHSAKTYRINSQ